MDKLKVNVILDTDIKIEKLNTEFCSNDVSTLHQGFLKYLAISAQNSNENDLLTSLEILKQIEILKIKNLDEEIEFLNKKRLKLLDNIALIEQKEIDQEKRKRQDDSAAEKLNSNLNVLEKIVEERSEIDVLPKSDEINGNATFGSQILPKNNVRHTQTDFSRHKSVRKITPVLQNYYKPLSLINKHTFSTEAIKLLDFDIPFGQLFSVTTGNPKVVRTHLLSHQAVSKGTDPLEDLNAEKEPSFLNEYVGHKGSINCMQYKSNLLLTGAKDAVVNVYSCQDIGTYHSDFEQIQPLASLDSHIDEVTALSYDGHTLVSASQDRTVRQWDLTKMCCVNTLDLNFIRNYYQVDGSRVSSASATPGKNSWMATTGGMRSRSDSIISRSTSVFDINAIIHGTPVSGESSAAMLLTPTLVTPSDLESSTSEKSTVFDNTPQISTSSPKFVSKLQVYDAALATGTSDGVVRLWDIRAQKIMRQLHSNSATNSENISICDMKFDSNQLLTTNYSNELLIWDLRMGKVLQMLKIGNNSVFEQGVQFEMDKKKLVIKDNATGTVYLYDRKSNVFVDWKEKAELHDSSDVECIRLKGGYLLEGYQSGVVKSWAM